MRSQQKEAPSPAEPTGRTSPEPEDPEEYAMNQEEKAIAKYIILQLDQNRDGYLTKDEFVEGCLADGDFMKLVNNFNGELIWGELLKKKTAPPPPPPQWD